MATAPGGVRFLLHEVSSGSPRLQRSAAATARHAACDLLRARHGRRRGASRRVDPLRRGDTVGLSDAHLSPALSPEGRLLARERQRALRNLLSVAGHLPRAQREAFAARLSGRSPMPPAARQALGAALATLRRHGAAAA